MKRLFADTYFFFAFLNGDDFSHAEAIEFYDGFNGELVTTEFVLTELADGLAGVADRQTFIDFYEALQSDVSVKIVSSTSELFSAGVALYKERKDKEWSLTDCISFTVMQREGLTEALTGDRHFEQAGFRALFRS